MLCLKNNTNPEWIISALKQIDNVIIDHAHCEKKAAHTGMVLLNRYPEKHDLGLEMADLIEEEICHYRSVLKILNKRGFTMSSDKGDEYVKQLFTQLRKDDFQLLDHLLIAGIIEARSCERLQILADHIEDEELKRFYSTLANSEAGHYMTFINLAKKYFDEKSVKMRLNELTDFEANVVKELPNLPLMHG